MGRIENRRSLKELLTLVLSRLYKKKKKNNNRNVADGKFTSIVNCIQTTKYEFVFP